MAVTEAALRHDGHVVAYPEGRISLDPELWPERGRTGLARLALRTRAPVIPVSQWGAHEVTAYEDNAAMFRTTLSSISRQPRLSVHFGVPVPLDDLDAGRRGDAHRAARRIVALSPPGWLRCGPTKPARRDTATRPVPWSGAVRRPSPAAWSRPGCWVPRWTAEGQAERVPA